MNRREFRNLEIPSAVMVVEAVNSLCKNEQVAELVDAPSIKLIGTKGSNISLIQHEVINHVVAKTSR